MKKGMKKVTFDQTTKPYSGANPKLVSVMLAILWFLQKRNQLPDLIAAFVQQFEWSRVTYDALSTLHSSMAKAIADCQMGKSFRYPLLFPRGRRQGENPRVLFSSRRLALLGEIKRLVEERRGGSSGSGASSSSSSSSSSGGGGAAAPPAA